MFWLGSWMLRTPWSNAVPGMSCMSPRAPFGDTARGWKPDSALMTAFTKARSIW